MRSTAVHAKGGGKERGMSAQLHRDGNGFSRRTFLQGTLAAAGIGVAGGALAGCGSPLSAGLVASPLDPGTLTFWNLFGGGDGARLTVMLDQYAQEQGGPASLQAATFSWGNPYYTKLSLATLGDKPPDVAVSHGTYTVTGPKMPPEGLKGHYQTVDVKQGGAWKTATLHLAAMPPTPPPAQE